MIFKNEEIEPSKLLGKGKGGYSYLVNWNNKKCVLKQFHHEEVFYYNFSDSKLSLELRDYETLKKVDILIPELYDFDEKNEMLIKEYIDGPTCFDLVKENRMRDDIISQVRSMCSSLYPNNLNIDYYPTNFIYSNNKLYYIDYECNPFDNKWSFESWGIKYWSLTPEFMEVLKK